MSAASRCGCKSTERGGILVRRTKLAGEGLQSSTNRADYLEKRSLFLDGNTSLKLAKLATHMRGASF